MTRYDGFIALFCFFVSVIAIPFAVTEWMMGGDPVATSFVRPDACTPLEQINYYHKAGSGLLLSEVLKEIGNPYRYLAVRHLQDMDYRAAFPVIQKCLSETKDAQLVWHAITALDSFGVWEAEKSVINVLNRSDNKAIRGAAMKFLGGSGSERAREILLPLAKSGSDNEKFAAALALGLAGDVRAIPLLESLAMNDLGQFRAKLLPRLKILKGSLGSNLLSRIIDTGKIDELVLAGLLTERTEMMEFLTNWQGSAELQLEAFWTVWRVQATAGGMLAEEAAVLVNDLSVPSEIVRIRRAMEILTCTNQEKAMQLLLGVVSSTAMHVNHQTWSVVRKIFQIARRTSVASAQTAEFLSDRG